ncbi:MAG TPA: riboflavin biosynthesis protein RibF [bacterium]|jgi:riboflavin kinase/FMN adenylyltransferase|nr:riboflavin biosynthesis protein RibF [bacterium]
MREASTLPLRGASARPLVLAIGVFDGMHLGHQAVLKAAVGIARRKGWTAAALTFDPPPEAALGLPVPPRLEHPDEQSAVMAGLGLRELYRIPFTRALGRRSAESFAASVLKGRLRCGAVAVGRGFRFGAGAAGTVETLRALGARLGFGVEEVAPVLGGGKPLSSTRLRQAVQEGRMDAAGRLLGRPWLYRGVVVRGRRLGRTIGFPTANLEGPQEVLPPRGVWAGRCRMVSRSGHSRWWAFAGNLGLRPTVKPLPGQEPLPSVELHLLGFQGGLEGKTIEAEFLRRLRPERKFGSLAALSAQIGRDVVAARKLLGKL